MNDKLRAVSLPAACADLVDVLTMCDSDLIGVRRQIHRNPELAWEETQTTKLVGEWLTRAGVTCTPLGRSGLVADLGPQDAAYRVGLRADLDALPLQERTDLPFSSRVAGVAHACGHDVHTTALLGAGWALAHRREALDDAGLGVRLIFQPAEEVMPGGGHLLYGSHHLEGLDEIFALHCDPSRDVGEVGLREGPVTAAGDAVTVTLHGRGGHSSRPHLTQDLTYALAKVVTDVPAGLSRRLDPRAGVSLVWGKIHSGTVGNVIPETGTISGTLRMLDSSVWSQAEPLVRHLVESIAGAYGVTAEIDYQQGVPPVVNSRHGVGVLDRAARGLLGDGGVGPTVQSLGGEDFGWLLRNVEGALARLGTRTPGGATYDLHQGDLVVDEKAVGVGARLLACAPFVAAARGA